MSNRSGEYLERIVTFECAPEIIFSLKFREPGKLEMQRVCF